MLIYNIDSSIHSTDLGLCLSQEQEKGYHLDRLPVRHIYAFIHTLESPPDPDQGGNPNTQTKTMHVQGE